jgi:hypothetical protein
MGLLCVDLNVKPGGANAYPAYEKQVGPASEAPPGIKSNYSSPEKPARFSRN